MAVIILLVLVVAGIAAMNKSKEKSSEPMQLDQATLQRALIQVTDLPTGFAARPDLLDGGNVHPCAATFTEPQFAAAEAGYSKGQMEGPYLVDRLHSYAGGDSAAVAYLADLRNAAASCTSFKSQGDTENIAPLSFPRLGDDTLAFRISGQGIVIDDVFVRVGATIIGIGYGGLANTDTSQTEHYAHLALQKLSDAA